MAITSNSQGHPGDRPAGRRSRQAAKRLRRVEFALTDEEFAELDAAATQAGLARGAYAAQAALANARGEDQPGRRSGAGGTGGGHPLCWIGPEGRSEPEPGGREAERHRTVFRRPSSVRGGEHPEGAPPGRGGGGTAEEASVIGKVLRGERPAGLIHYLYGPGKHEEHTDPHIVAGWRHPAELEPPLRPDGRRDFRELNGLLQQTLAALGDRAPNRPVWHCVARAAPGDRMLSDDEWASVAGEIMHRTGLAPYGEQDDAVRWVAIRHADNHIHIVATLARQDGRRPRVSNDYYRVREACLAVENRFGLERTAPGDRTAASRPTRAETEKTQRRGWQEAPRITLKREVSTAAAAASSEQEFFAHLQQAGVQVRKRFSTRNPGEVTGYSVALPHDTTASGEPVWYGGGKLAADLTLPKAPVPLGQQPPSEPELSRAAGSLPRNAPRSGSTPPAPPLTQPGRSVHSPPPVTAPPQRTPRGPPRDTLHAAAAALGSRVVRQAATAYDRAARVPYGRIPRPTPAGNSLRRAARLLSAAAFVSHDRTLAQIALIARLAALADAVTELREAQRHAAQAAAARRAAERLHAAAAGTGSGFRSGACAIPSGDVAGSRRHSLHRLGRAVPPRPRHAHADQPVPSPRRGAGRRHTDPAARPGDRRHRQ